MQVSVLKVTKDAETNVNISAQQYEKCKYNHTVTLGHSHISVLHMVM